jgi:hypothetical protein
MEATLKILKAVFETIVLYLHGSDDKKAKRVTALVIICLLIPQAVPGYVKMIYGYVYAWKNNEPPNTIATSVSRPPETFNSYPASTTETHPIHSRHGGR